MANQQLKRGDRAANDPVLSSTQYVWKSYLLTFSLIEI